jgi:cytidylate kinase
MSNPSIIAIDGPAASGKSTLGRRLAASLGYLYFDTGVMYRAVTWLVLNRGININDESIITELAEQTNIDIQPASREDGRSCDVLVNGEDVSCEIRSPEVDAYVSVVSAYSGVRKALSLQQRQIGLRGRVVMVGRDIGTVVLKEADLKIYLDASAEDRARRRYLEIIEHGGTAEYEQVLNSVRERDEIDSTRDIAPLHPAEDAVIVNSDEMNADEVFVYVEAMCR